MVELVEAQRFAGYLIIKHLGVVHCSAAFRPFLASDASAASERAASHGRVPFDERGGRESLGSVQCGFTHYQWGYSRDTIGICNQQYLMEIWILGANRGPWRYFQRGANARWIFDWRVGRVILQVRASQERWLQLTKPAPQSLDSYERRYCCNWIKNRLGYQLNVIRMGWTAGFSLHVWTLLTGLQMSEGRPPGRLQGLLKATRRLAQEAPGPGIPTTKPRSSLVRRRFQGREWAFQQEIMGYFSFKKKKRFEFSISMKKTWGFTVTVTCDSKPSELGDWSRNNGRQLRSTQGFMGSSAWRQQKGMVAMVVETSDEPQRVMRRSIHSFSVHHVLGLRAFWVIYYTIIIL